MHLDETSAALIIGAEGHVELVVGADDTAIAARSGDLPVLSTPRMVALMEEASVRAVAADLPDGATSVGTRLDVRHRAPTPIGAVVTAVAVVREVTGSRLVFDVSATHVIGGVETPIGDGTHARAIVDRASFAPPAQDPQEP